MELRVERQALESQAQDPVETELLKGLGAQMLGLKDSTANIKVILFTTIPFVSCGFTLVYAGCWWENCWEHPLVICSQVACAQNAWFRRASQDVLSYISSCIWQKATEATAKITRAETQLCARGVGPKQTTWAPGKAPAAEGEANPAFFSLQ